MDRRDVSKAGESRGSTGAILAGLPSGPRTAVNEDVGRSAFERDMMSLPTEVGLRADYRFVTEWQEERTARGAPSAIRLPAGAR